MGRWAQYRRRGTVHISEPPTVVLVERNLTGDSSHGLSSGFTWILTKPIQLVTPQWRIQKVGLRLRKGTGAGTYRFIVQASTSTLPNATTLGTTASVVASGLPAVFDWVELDLTAPVVVGPVAAIFVGITISGSPATPPLTWEFGSIAGGGYFYGTTGTSWTNVSESVGGAYRLIGQVL